jgi:hypothetical protein
MGLTWRDLVATLFMGAIAIIVAFTAALIGLITGSTVALAVLVAATFTLWFIATTRHAITALAGAAGGRDNHEAIHPRDVAPR